jgi:hypothetical protein
MQPPTYAAGVRQRYEDLPVEVHAWVEQRLGEPVVRVRDQVGGFSPGVAAVVTGRDGGSFFVKAVGSAVNADAVRFYRRERDAALRLPRVPGILLPVASAELEAADQSFPVIVFPALEGATPRHPWSPGDVTRVLDALADVSTQLTPSPWPDEDGPNRLVEFFRWWQRLADDDEDPWHDHPWLAGRWGDVVAAEERLRAGLGGSTLSHTDLRADNVVLTAERVWFVDWAHAQNAAPWVDAAVLLADVVASGADLVDGGGVDVLGLTRTHPALGGAGPEQLWRLLIGLAGALHGLSRRPSPPGLPTIRGWQGGTADTLLRWCVRLDEGSNLGVVARRC